MSSSFSTLARSRLDLYTLRRIACDTPSVLLSHYLTSSIICHLLILSHTKVRGLRPIGTFARRWYCIGYSHYGALEMATYALSSFLFFSLGD